MKNIIIVLIIIINNVLMANANNEWLMTKEINGLKIYQNTKDISVDKKKMAITVMLKIEDNAKNKIIEKILVNCPNQKIYIKDENGSIRHFEMAMPEYELCQEQFGIDYQMKNAVKTYENKIDTFRI